MDFIENALRICKSKNLQVPEIVIQAMRSIDRKQFMLEKYRSKANRDEPYPILNSQTISAPHMVMMMLTRELFDPENATEVLEIGTGSGYNAAVLSKIFNHVHTIERHHDLVEFARDNLRNAGIDNVTIYEGDGTNLNLGRNFSRITVTAAGPYIPDSLIRHLDEGGILLLPVESIYSQILVRVDKKKGVCNFLKSNSEYQGEVSCTTGPSVRFVPLVGEEGYK